MAIVLCKQRKIVHRNNVLNNKMETVSESVHTIFYPELDLELAKLTSQLN